MDYLLSRHCLHCRTRRTSFATRASVVVSFWTSHGEPSPLRLLLLPQHNPVSPEIPPTPSTNLRRRIRGSHCVPPCAHGTICAGICTQYLFLHPIPSLPLHPHCQRSRMISLVVRRDFISRLFLTSLPCPRFRGISSAGQRVQLSHIVTYYSFEFDESEFVVSVAS